MKPVCMAIAAVALFAVGPAFAEESSSPTNDAGAPGITAKPGKVGPGSENNATVSPTSPSMTSPPPPDLPAGSSSGASSGSSGAAKGSSTNDDKSGSTPSDGPTTGQPQTPDAQPPAH